MSEQKTFEFESIPESQNVTIDPLSASEVKTNTTKEDNEGSIKYPHYFRISKESLVNIVEDYTRRDFSQEIDRLEAMGGDDFIQKGVSTSFSYGIKTFPAEGMSRREDEYGNNRTRKSENLWKLMAKGFISSMFKILPLCSIAAIVLDLTTSPESGSKRPLVWIDSSAILLLLIIASILDIRNQYNKEKDQLVFWELQEPRKAQVMRDGSQIQIPANQVLVGDIVQISAGMKVPSDGYIIQSWNLVCDESMFTGDTNPTVKNSLKNCIAERDRIINEGKKKSSGNHEVPSPVLLSGSLIVEGKGDFIVIAVGSLSSLGRIKAKLEQQEELSPLQKNLEMIKRRIGRMGIFSALLIFVVLMTRFIIERVQEVDFNSESVNDFLCFLMIEISLVVAMTPDGISLAVVMSLAYCAKEIVKDNILVRNLNVCETMASVNIICTEKTGILTQNKLTVCDFWNEKTYYSDPVGLVRDILPEDLRKLFMQLFVLNNAAQLKPYSLGSATDIALLNFVERCSGDYEKAREGCEVVQKFPFSSSRKRMGTIIKIQGNRLRLLEKGSSELLLDSCSSMHCLESNEVFPMNEERRQRTMEAINYLGGAGERTLILAYKDFDSSENLDESDDRGVVNIEKGGLILFSLIGIRDVLHMAVPQAVRQCQKAKIKVKMITADNKITARAVAKECNIVSNEEKNTIMEGPEFMNRIGGVVCKNCRKNICDCAPNERLAAFTNKPLRKDSILNAQEFNNIYENIDVLARSRPEDKYAYVVGLKERGHVVAVTGDDVISLKAADVGISMGISGTDLAKEASGIILLDDNFSSIVQAVIWARNTHHSIRKSLQFQLTLMIVAVGTSLIGALALRQNIFTPIQMLWISLILETLANLALVSESPNADLLEKKPFRTSKSIISKKMWKHIIGQAIYQLIILMVLIFAGESFLPEYPDSFDVEIEKKGLNRSVKYNGDYVRSGRYDNENGYRDLEYEFGPSRHFTIIFNTFVWMQIFNFLNCRRIGDEKNVFENITRNCRYFLIFFIIVFFQSLIVTYGCCLFHIYHWSNIETGGAGLHINQWFICIGFGAGSLIISFLLKFVPEKKLLR